MILSRIANLFRGFLSLFVSGVERRNPEALLEVERENLRVQIAQYNQGLASHAGLAERLMSQVRKLETEEQELRARTTAKLRAGNRDLAGELALRPRRSRRSAASLRRTASRRPRRTTPTRTCSRPATSPSRPPATRSRSSATASTT